MPKESYHRRQNMNFRDKYFVKDWIHPFAHTFADFVVETVEEIESIKDKIFSIIPKDLSVIDKAIKHKEENNL